MTQRLADHGRSSGIRALRFGGFLRRDPRAAVTAGPLRVVAAGAWIRVRTLVPVWVWNLERLLVRRPALKHARLRRRGLPGGRAPRRTRPRLLRRAPRGASCSMIAMRLRISGRCSCVSRCGSGSPDISRASISCCRVSAGRSESLIAATQTASASSGADEVQHRAGLCFNVVRVIRRRGIVRLWLDRRVVGVLSSPAQPSSRRRGVLLTKFPRRRRGSIA